MNRGTVNTPDTVSLLLRRAGDVESNPGPDDCKDCGRAFSHQSRPISCSSCHSRFCRIAKGGQASTCIGITRWQLMKALDSKKPIVCRLCKGETPRKVHQFNEGVTPGRCAAPGCKCKQKIKEGSDFLICTVCSKHYHKKKECSDMFRLEVEKLNRAVWACPACTEERERKSAAEDAENRANASIRSTQFEAAKATETKLKILQLNVDCITSKMEELKSFLKKNEIDIFLLQETKLIKNDRPPRFPGYTIERKDRVQPKGKEKDRGGGLLMGIKNTIPYKYLNKMKIGGIKDHITEAQTIEIPTTNKQKIRITNVYVPPHNSAANKKTSGSERSEVGSERPNGTRGGSSRKTMTTSVNKKGRAGRGGSSTGNQVIRTTRRRSGGERTTNRREPSNSNAKGQKERGEKEPQYFDLSRWPGREFDMICGDINAHSILWDDTRASKEADPRGKIVEDWLANNNMIPANDGSPTHDSRSSGTESAPDVTLVHTSMMDKVSWRTVKELSSDHRPIIITYCDYIPVINNRPTYKWKLREADWTKFREEVESNVPVNYKKKNTNKLEKILRKTILKAANKHICKKKVTEKTKCYMTEDVKKEIKERNKLRRTISTNREEWIESCKKVSEMIRKEKSDRWSEYVQTLNRKSDSREIFKTVRAIDGKYPPKKDNEVLEVNGRAYVTDAQKAEQFAKTYRSFSKLPKCKEDRKIRKLVRKQKKVPRVMEESECEITMGEMMQVINETSNNKASGGDDIPYEMIKNLGTKALEMLLHLYKRCWSGDGIPTKWREATIKTLLKEDKDPKDPTSYRPISLTSCLGKVMEKIVANRLIHILERRGILTDNQAGFRPGRCTTDQVLKLVQEASDNMHENPRGRTTIATFFDYSKAYDSVWRDGLLYKMVKNNIPYRFIRYVRHFLSGRKTVVNINNTNSKVFVLKDGLPQGSSISPILFLLFINDIDVDLDLETAASLFADDTAIWRKDGVVKGSQRQLMQGEVDKITEWARVWKMKVNGGKTKSMSIASSKTDQMNDPKLKADETPIKHGQEYPFLGVKIPPDLKFAEHTKKVAIKGKKRNQVLKCMSGKKWGNTRETQRTIYVQYNRPALEYASPSWHAWTSKTHLETIQRVQNDALRAVVGAAATCPIDFLHLEANIEPIKNRLEKNDLLLREKYKRLPETDPRRELMESKKQVRLKTRLGWREMTSRKQPEKEYKVEEIKPPLEPWRRTTLDFDAVPLTKTKELYSKQELKELTQNKINNIRADVRIWTDGSTNSNQEKGGAGIFIEDTRSGESEEHSYPAGEICSSFGAEGVAMLRALEWLEMKPAETAIICTDSLSVHAALKKDDWKDAQDWVRKIKLQSRKIGGKVTIVWVPSHCGVDGNEKADRLADEGTKLDQTEVPITHAIAKARIKRTKWSTTHKRAKEIFQEKRKPKLQVERQWPRRVQSLFSRLRSGHAKELRQYMYKIDVAEDPYCECGEEESIIHVLCDCPILESTRRSVMQEPVMPHHLVTEPEKSRQILAVRFKDLNWKHDLSEETRCEASETTHTNTNGAHVQN